MFSMICCVFLAPVDCGIPNCPRLPHAEMRGTGIHNVSWPSRDKAEKVCLRRKLQPLAVPAREAPPARTAVELDTEERTERSFVPPQRLARPRTAERAPALAVVSFPARLQLRAPGEVPGPPGPFTGPGNLVLPLDTQDAVKVLVSACAEGKTEIIDGSCLTAWTLPESSRSQDLEPLTARRIDRTLAVEPIELVAERQGGSQEGPIRYGEGFRLRAAGTKALYLGYEGIGTCWKSGEDRTPPKGTRFSAHGGELGAPLHFGRPVSLRRVPSPPPSEVDSDPEFSDEDVERPWHDESSKLQEIGSQSWRDLII